MNREKSLYFRKVNDVAHDDDDAASVIVPSGSIHYLSTSSSNLTIHFNSLHSTPLAGQANDSIVLPCSISAKAELMAEEILAAINYGESGVIIVVVNVTETYLKGTYCNDITSINIAG